MSKKSVLIIFGGNSTEHEVSCKSVMNFIKNIPDNKYTKHLVGIKKNGDWVYYRGNTDLIPLCKWADSETNVSAMLCPNKGLVLLDGSNTVIPVDAVIPVLHGKNGEDGTVQGLFELCSIPYVGCGVVASGVSMDKAYTKIIVDSLKNIPQASYVLIKQGDSDGYAEEAEEKFGYPMFIKPCKSGSSQGVSKAENRTELKAAVSLALKHDSKVLVEQAINGRELECAVFEKNGEILCSDAGEAVAGDVFYSYEAKYSNSQSKTVLHPDIPTEVNEKIKEYSRAVFKALGCNGLSRIDFFMEKNGRVVFNEINTMPGFTEISMYPMMMGEIGYPIEKLMDELISSAGCSK